MIKPLFIWAGGKTKMLKHYRPLFPKKYDSYIEPFFGGGAMFLEAFQKNSTANFFLSDINSEIISIYKTIKEHCEEFISELDFLSKEYIPLSFEDRKIYYYNLREQNAYYSSSWSEVKSAAVLYFLMKTSFNGIWQINKNTNNKFGTPCGLLNHKTEVYDKENVRSWSKCLNFPNVKIENCDYQETINLLGPNSWLYLDPPYRNCHVTYNTDFSDKNQLEVVDFAAKAMKNGSVSWISNKEIGDNFFQQHIQSNNYDMNIYNFEVTYTAGRRKKKGNVFEAKKATEILIIGK